MAILAHHSRLGGNIRAPAHMSVCLLAVCVCAFCAGPPRLPRGVGGVRFSRLRASAPSRFLRISFRAVAVATVFGCAGEYQDSTGVKRGRDQADGHRPPPPLYTHIDSCRYLRIDVLCKRDQSFVDAKLQISHCPVTTPLQPHTLSPCVACGRSTPIYAVLGIAYLLRICCCTFRAAGKQTGRQLAAGPLSDAADQAPADAGARRGPPPTGSFQAEQAAVDGTHRAPSSRRSASITGGLCVHGEEGFCVHGDASQGLIARG